MLLPNREAHRKFWANGVSFWEEICELWGLGDGHYQRGIKGTREKARQGNELVSGVELVELCAEPMVSSVMTTIAFLHSAAPVNAKEKSAEQLDLAFQAWLELPLSRSRKLSGPIHKGKHR